MKKPYAILLILAFLFLFLLSISALAQDNPEPALTQRLDSLETRIAILEQQILCLQEQLTDPDNTDCDLETIKSEAPAFVSTPTPTSTFTPTPISTPTPVPTDTPVPSTPTFTPEPEPEGYGDGTYLVGSDIPPGIYRSPGGSLCYWERLSGLSGEFTDIIANGVEEGVAIVEIQESDVAFKSQGCETWTLIE